MNTAFRAFFGAMALTLVVTPLQAQEVALAGAPATTEATDSTEKGAAVVISVLKPMEIQNLRAYDRRGLNVFETPKSEAIRYTGFKVNLGAAFTQQFQGIDH